MVMHHNRCKTLPVEVLPAAQHPNQHGEMFQNSVFSQKQTQEDAVKTYMFRAAAAGCHQGGATQNINTGNLLPLCFRQMFV